MSKLSSFAKLLYWKDGYTENIEHVDIKKEKELYIINDRFLF